MSNQKAFIYLAWGTLIGGISLAAARLLFGGDDGLIRGVGNSGNRIFADQLTDELADAIASHHGTPTITAEQLSDTFQTIVAHAQEGNLKAALVLFRIAEMQRSAKN